MLLLLAWLAGWADAQDENGPSSEIRQWLDRPNRQDFDWNVRLFGPWLSFQQRHVAEVEVVLPVRKLVRAGLSLSDLHFALKVKDETSCCTPIFSSGLEPTP